ncbi:uncharacterized protein LOC141903767 isoform X2 [Tubulanus polymorphus]|uniref:uncharacterized protein LOC141903767 isoform X2 n=1 Tax=Tubulanus polymorphus TaxID=672921 RepID=UPI003DA63768
MMADLTTNDRTVLLQHSEQTTVPAAQTAVMFAPQQQLQYAMPVGNMNYSMPTAQAVPVNVGMPSAAPGQQVYVLQGGNSANQPQIQPVAQPGMIQLQYGMTPAVQTPAMQMPADEPLFDQTPIPRSNIDGKRFTICGIVQIISGIICIASSVGVWADRRYIEGGGIGIWGGVLFIVAGAFGIVNGKKFLKCYMITCFSLSIVAALCAFGTILVSLNWVYRMCYLGWAPGMYCVTALAALSEFITSICQASFFCRYLVRMCNNMKIQQQNNQQVPIVIYLNIPPGYLQQPSTDKEMSAQPPTYNSVTDNVTA